MLGVGNATENAQNGEVRPLALTIPGAAEAEAACAQIVDFKTNGLFGSDYLDSRRLIILFLYG